MNSIDLYLKEGTCDNIILNDAILHEKFQMKDLIDKVSLFNRLGKKIVTLKSKKDEDRIQHCIRAGNINTCELKVNQHSAPHQADRQKEYAHQIEKNERMKITHQVFFEKPPEKPP